MKLVWILALCLTQVLARPGLERASTVKPTQPTHQDIEHHSKHHSEHHSKHHGEHHSKHGRLLKKLLNSLGVPQWFEKMADDVDIDLRSMGQIDNSPKSSGVTGQLYHKLTVDFPEDRHGHLFVDHRLDELKRGDGGTLGFGVDTFVPYVGSLNVLGAQSFDANLNGTVAWDLDLNDEEWRNVTSDSSESQETI